MVPTGEGRRRMNRCPGTTTTRALTPRDMASGVGNVARNIALALGWNTDGNHEVKLYGWEPSFIPKPEFSRLRPPEWAVN